MIKFRIGLGIFLGLLLVAIFAPWLAPYDPQEMRLAQRLDSPSSQHWFGLDENGSDVFSKILYGARVSLSVALCVVCISVWIGLILGSLAGFFGAKIDHFIMRVVDIFVAFPGFLIALAFVAILGPSLGNLIFALCFTSWTSFTRLVRGEVLHLKEREHVYAARAIGANTARIMALHIWPGLLGLLAVQATFAAASTIVAESGLSFLGLGVRADIATWGSVLSSGRRVLAEAPHVALAAIAAILLLVMAFNLIGDGLREILDPRRAPKSR